MTKQQLIEDNMKLVYSLISKEYPNLIADEDIIQCGMLGLCQAADKFDESMGCKFSGFAWFCIRHEIIRELNKRSKHQGLLSLDYEYTDKFGEKFPFGDLIVGEEDVMYVDDCEHKLTPKQRQISKLLQKGIKGKDIAKMLGVTHQYVSWVRRKIRLLRGRNNGD